MGASHPGDIAELVDIAEPDFGLITNVGRGHLLGFGSFEGVVDTKCELDVYKRQIIGKNPNNILLLCDLLIKSRKSMRNQRQKIISVQ